MRLLFTTLLLPASLAAAAFPCDSVRVSRFQIGVVLQAGPSFQRAADGSTFDPAFFREKKVYNGFGYGLRAKAALGHQLEARLSVTQARRGQGLVQHNFNNPNAKDRAEYNRYNMASELGFSLLRIIAPQCRHSFSVGAGYSYNLHRFTSESISASSGPGSQDSPMPTLSGIMVETHTGNRPDSYTSHTASAEINYLPRINNKRPLEIGLSYHHDLTAAPELTLESARLGADRQVVERFRGTIVPVNSSLRLNMAWYLFSFGR